MKGISSVLKGSSQFWKGTFNNLGKNFCNCTRGENLGENINGEETESNTKNQKGNKLIIFKVEIYTPSGDVIKDNNTITESESSLKKSSKINYVIIVNSDNASKPLINSM